MDDLVITVYELATLLVPFLVAYAVVRTIASRTGRTTAGLLPGLVFALYVFAVLYVTGVGTVYDLADMANGTPRLPNQVNVVPFAGGITMGTVLNAVMFVPLGFLLPLMWRRGARLAPVVGFGFAFSLAIELTQLLNNRTTDIDDLLMNTLGVGTAGAVSLGGVAFNLVVVTLGNIVGGGLVGCEAGLFLQKTGHEVTVVELLGRLANESFGMYREALIWEMEKCGMAMLPKTRCLEITPTGVKVEKDGKKVRVCKKCGETL